MANVLSSDGSLTGIRTLTIRVDCGTFKSEIRDGSIDHRRLEGGGQALREDSSKRYCNRILLGWIPILYETTCFDLFVISGPQLRGRLYPPRSRYRYLLSLQGSILLLFGNMAGKPLV